ncbi:hypothetical protein AMTR_s00048p00147210 [Amborella trichopoda]|uniref:Uncharacterized protein n=1 Tax=Amborella trichopoda TaxID=13333 RepID=U5D2F9_AMBTC|nr:hypothetical protein AMTR_s00048p00147210 [Amborella trichopoda]
MIASKEGVIQVGPFVSGDHVGSPSGVYPNVDDVSVHGRSAAQVSEEKIVMAASPRFSSVFEGGEAFSVVKAVNGFALPRDLLSNPLGVDPLAIIVVEEDDVHQILNEGVIAMDPTSGVGFDAPILEDGPQDLALVAANDYLPLNTIPQDHNLLLLQFTAKLPKEVVVPEAPDTPVVEVDHVAAVDDHKINAGQDGDVYEEEAGEGRCGA